MARYLLLLLILGISGRQALHGQEPRDPSLDEAAIRKMVVSYVQAFNSHDAKSLANHWSPDAVYLNRSTGEEVVGRDAIVDQFATLFKEQPELKLVVEVTSIQFVSPNVAIEQGTAKLLGPNSEPEMIEYSAVDIKRDGNWLLDRVTDSPKSSTPAHYDQLKELEWMVGTWSEEDPDANVELECNWTKNKNFLTRAFKISLDGEDMSGMQIIGWDPAAKAIRSWTFDSNGAFTEAKWDTAASAGISAIGALCPMADLPR